MKLCVGFHSQGVYINNLGCLLHLLTGSVICRFDGIGRYVFRGLSYASVVMVLILLLFAIHHQMVDIIFVNMINSAGTMRVLKKTCIPRALVCRPGAQYCALCTNLVDLTDWWRVGKLSLCQ